MNEIKIISKYNQEYADTLAKALTAWANYNKVKITELVVREYKDKPKALIIHRPHRFLKPENLFKDEQDGIRYEFYLSSLEPHNPIGDQRLQALLLELQGRLYNHAWTTEIFTEEELFNYCYGETDYPFTMPSNDKAFSERCWHHNMITYNRHFCAEEIYKCIIEYGYCYCS